MRLYGKNPVLERIKTKSRTIKELFLQQKTDLSEIVKAAKKYGVSFESVDKGWFTTNCGNSHTQGVMAEIDDFSYIQFDEVLSKCLKKETVMVFLDGITDPQNLGAIIRNLACLGGFSIILPKYNSAHVNETVLRVANGGENYLEIAQVTNNVKAVKTVREKGIYVVGAALENSENILHSEFKEPLAVVIGSEGKGIRPGLLKCLDKNIHLPMPGADLSYNAAVAASLFCYEINRRKWT